MCINLDPCKSVMAAKQQCISTIKMPAFEACAKNVGRREAVLFLNGGGGNPGIKLIRSSRL